MIWHDICWVTCRSCQILLKQSWCPCLKLSTGQPMLWKDNLVCFIGLPLLNPSTCFMTVVLYNTKIMLVINAKDVSSYRFHCLPGISCDTVLSLVMLIWNQDKFGKFWPFLLCKNSSWSSRIRCSCFSVLSCNAAGNFILQHFIALLSIIGISSLNDQYGCSPSLPLFWFMSSHRVWGLTTCQYGHQLFLAFLFLLPSCSLVCLCMNLLPSLLCTFLEFLCLCVSVWIASLWWIIVAQTCKVFLCYISVFVIVFLTACVICLQHQPWRLLPVSCDL